MGLDKELYRQAYQALREWSDSTARLRGQDQLTPAEAWQQYVSLVEFCWRLSPQPSERQRKEKLEALERYYERLRKMEEWRRRSGKAT